MMFAMNDTVGLNKVEAYDQWKVNRGNAPLQFSAISINVLIAFFSPLVSFYMGVFFLLWGSRYIDRKKVKWLGYLIAYSGSIMVASRATFALSDDFTHYYAAYLQVLNEGWHAIYGQYGTEIGLTTFYYILSPLNITSPVFPLFAVAMLSSALFVLWLDKYGSAYFPVNRYGTVMAVSLLFYGFLSVTLVTRQMVSLSFLLLAISIAGWRSLILLFCAVLFHQAALLPYILLKYAKKLNWFWFIFVLGVAIIFGVFFNQIVQIAVASDIDFIRVASKFAYYLDSAESYTASDISGLKFVGICIVTALLSAKFMPKGWGMLIILVGILYVIFLPFPLVSLRTFLIFVSVLSGYIASFTAFRLGWLSLNVLTSIYAIYTIVKQFNITDDNIFPLWDKFDWFGSIPFYYFLN